MAVLVGIRWAISMSRFEISIPAPLKRLIHREAVWEADSRVSPSGRQIILILYWKLYLCSCSMESPIFRLGMTANLGVAGAV